MEREQALVDRYFTRFAASRAFLTRCSSHGLQDGEKRKKKRTRATWTRLSGYHLLLLPLYYVARLAAVRGKRRRRIKGDRCAHVWLGGRELFEQPFTRGRMLREKRGEEERERGRKGFPPDRA